MSGVWTGPQLCCNCAACLALSRLRGCLRSKDILVHTDNTATIAYISWQGGLLSHLCSQNHLMSLRAIHIPGVFNRAADELISMSASRGVETPSPDGSADLGMVRSCLCGLVCISRNHPLPVVLLPNRANARHGCTGTQLALGPVKICVTPSEPTSTDPAQDQGGGAGCVSGSILAQQDLIPRTYAPRDSPSLAKSS